QSGPAGSTSAGVERIEQVLDLLLGHSASVVVDDDPNRILLVVSRNDDLSAIGAGVESIAKDVDEQQFDLQRAHRDFGEGVVQVELDGRAVAVSVRPDEIVRLSDDRV